MAFGAGINNVKMAFAYPDFPPGPRLAIMPAWPISLISVFGVRIFPKN
jgi:hypothetical protein